MKVYECINCGNANWLGDCCENCAALECDECALPIDFDGDILDKITGARLCDECAQARGSI